MTNYQVIKTPDELRRAVEIISSQPVVGLDTETTELDPYIAVASDSTRHARPASSSSTSMHLPPARQRRCKRRSAGAMRRLLAAPRPIKIAHNAKFDAKFIKHNLGVDSAACSTLCSRAKSSAPATSKSVMGWKPSPVAISE